MAQKPRAAAAQGGSAARRGAAQRGAAQRGAARRSAAQRGAAAQRRYVWMVSEAMRPPETKNWKRSSAVPPGKLPSRWFVTV